MPFLKLPGAEAVPLPVQLVAPSPPCMGTWLLTGLSKALLSMLTHAGEQQKDQISLARLLSRVGFPKTIPIKVSSEIRNVDIINWSFLCGAYCTHFSL